MNLFLVFYLIGLYREKLMTITGAHSLSRHERDLPLPSKRLNSLNRSNGLNCYRGAHLIFYPYIRSLRLDVRSPDKAKSLGRKSV